MSQKLETEDEVGVADAEETSPSWACRLAATNSTPQQGGSARRWELVLTPGHVHGRPFVLPPGAYRPERAEALAQKAFMAAMTDPALLSDAKKANLDLEALSGIPTCRPWSRRSTRCRRASSSGPSSVFACHS